MTNLIELTVPDIGDFDSVEVIEILVNNGDVITANQDIITLESDKATMEIPADYAGTIEQVKLSVGDKVNQGSVIATLTISDVPAEPKPDEGQITAPTKIAEIPEVVAEPEAIIAEKITQAVNTNNISHASPSVRKFARELGVNLSLLTGTSPKNRITKDDVQNYVKATINTSSQPAPVSDNNLVLLKIPVVDFSKFGEVESKDLSRIKKISGKHLHACWLNIPHVTQFDEADITELEQFRKDNKSQGVNITPLVFIMKAVVATLKIYPNFNASLSPDGENLIIKNYFNIGVAVDTPDGLVVPVIKNIDKKGFLDLAAELAAISAKARDGALAIADIQGASFTVSSLGGIGGSFFTPIINAPEVAILGVGRHKLQPVWNGSEFMPRLMLPLALSYDHRVIDGALGARFITQLNQMLVDIRKVLL